MRSGFLLTLGAALLFGVGGSVAVSLLATLDPINAAQLRSAGAALIIGGMAYRRGQSGHGGRLWELAGLGLALALVTLAFYRAIERLGVGPGVTIQFSAPVLVLAWMRLVQRRHVPGPAWLAALLTLTGTALISRVWVIESMDPLGLAAAVTAAFTFTAYLLLTERLGRVLPSLSIAAYGFGFSALILLAFTPARLPPSDLRPWIELAWIVALGTVVPFLLEVKALTLADPGTVGVAASVEPLVAASVAWVWLGQAMSLAQVGGTVLTVAGVAAIQRITASAATPIT
jgi:drug/metabolite transporter (DMT)-like permease